MTCNREVNPAPPQPANPAPPSTAIAPPTNPANLPHSGIAQFINPNPTGNALVQAPTNQPATPPPQAQPPQSIHNQPPQVVKIPQYRGLTLRNWQGHKGGPPYYEGVVDNIDGPHSAQSQPALWKQMTAAMLLGKLNPMLGMGGYMMGKKEYHVWTCRLELAPPYRAVNNGSPAATVYVIHQQPQVGFQLGDTIAVWGKPDKGGNLIMQHAFVYETNSWVQVKK